MSAFTQPLAQVAENVRHIARGCLSGRSHDPTYYEQNIAAALDRVERLATDMGSLTEFRCAHEHRWWMNEHGNARRCPTCGTITFSEHKP